MPDNALHVWPSLQGVAESAVESCGWLAVMAEAATEEEDCMQKGSRRQGAVGQLAVGMKTCLAWTQTAGWIQLADRQDRQEAQVARVLGPAIVFAHGADYDIAAAAAAAAAAVEVLDAAGLVAAAQSKHCHRVQLQRELERVLFAQVLLYLLQHWKYAAGQAQALLQDSVAVLQSRSWLQQLVAWPQLLRSMRAQLHPCNKTVPA